jgi:hypothetical protein
VAKIPANSKTVEFDYTNGRYSKTWGKLTFAVDVPQSYQPSDNSLIGTWIYIMSKNITVTYIFNSDGTGFYNWVNGTYESPYTFTYKYAADGILLITRDGSKTSEAFFYSVQGNVMTVYGMHDFYGNPIDPDFTKQ